MTSEQPKAVRRWRVKELTRSGWVIMSDEWRFAEPYLATRSVAERFCEHLNVLQSRAEAGERLAVALSALVSGMQYGGLGDEELEQARAALKAYEEAAT